MVDTPGCERKFGATLKLDGRRRPFIRRVLSRKVLSAPIPKIQKSESGACFCFLTRTEFKAYDSA